MRDVVDRRPCASKPNTTVSDTSQWLPIICPVCHTIAHALPDGPDEMSIACITCFPYRLTWAAERVLTAAKNPIDRLDLSRTSATPAPWPARTGR